MPKDEWKTANLRAKYGPRTVPPKQTNRIHKQKKTLQQRLNNQAKQIHCPHCRAHKTKLSLQTYKDGTTHVRADCQNCQRFIKWVR